MVGVGGIRLRVGGIDGRVARRDTRRVARFVRGRVACFILGCLAGCLAGGLAGLVRGVDGDAGAIRLRDDSVVRLEDYGVVRLEVSGGRVRFDWGCGVRLDGGGGFGRVSFGRKRIRRLVVGTWLAGHIASYISSSITDWVADSIASYVRRVIASHIACFSSIAYHSASHIASLIRSFTPIAIAITPPLERADLVDTHLRKNNYIEPLPLF